MHARLTRYRTFVYTLYVVRRVTVTDARRTLLTVAVPEWLLPSAREKEEEDEEEEDARHFQNV